MSPVEKAIRNKVKSLRAAERAYRKAAIAAAAAGDYAIAIRRLVDAQVYLWRAIQAESSMTFVAIDRQQQQMGRKR